MYDVTIIGAGLAGSLAAHLLARTDLRIAVVDPAPWHRDEFRAEQIVGPQVAALRGLGLLERIVADRPCIGSARRYDSVGRFLGRVSAPHYGVAYAAMVNALRPMPSNVDHILDAVTHVETQEKKQILVLHEGGPLATRLTVLATGLRRSLHRRLDEQCERLSAHHSVAYGFDVQLDGPLEEVVVMYGDVANRIDYLTLFPYESGRVRGNLFTYGDPGGFRMLLDKEDGLHALLPGLRRAIGRVRMEGAPVVRSNHLWVSRIARPGVVAIGDAYQTPCPAAGTGVTRLLSDVQALLRHAPHWLRADDVSPRRIAEYYADSIRAAADAMALHDARYRRAARTQTSMRWRVHRWRVRQQIRLGSILTLATSLLS
jgi:2-polyprenyl-6-methoxyphenol hydroxylase-like FAD-dependent oxidoreductase